MVNNKVINADMAKSLSFNFKLCGVFGGKEMIGVLKIVN